MPTSPSKPCNHVGCRNLTQAGSYCDQHKKLKQQQFDATRGSSSQRGYGYRWQKTSKAYLRAHPLCQCPDCLEGEITLLAANVVDHKIPHRGDMKLFWDNTNWQAMNKSCHDKKTASEDGGFKGVGG